MNLAIDNKYGLLYKGKVYATGAESIHTRIANKQIIDDELVADAERITDWLDTYSVWCD